MRYRFGTKGLIGCLLCLGFTKGGVNNSSHQKYNLPHGHSVAAGQRPFITVILGKKVYADQTAAKYIHQISALGFDKPSIDKCLKDT